LAQIGSRLVDGAARKIAAEFFKRFSAQLQGAPEADGNEASAEGEPLADADADSESKEKKSWTAWISKS
jgi:hypothetical protein